MTAWDQWITKQLFHLLQLLALCLRQAQSKRYDSNESKAAVQPEGT